MKEKRYRAICDPVSHSLFGLLEHFKLLLVFEKIFWQTLVGSRGCPVNGKYGLFGALHHSIPEHPGLLTH